MHKILDFDRYRPEPPSASKHRVNLVEDEFDQTPIAENISLEELYDHVSPGKMLYMTQPITKKVAGNLEKMRAEDVPSQNKNYAITSAHSIEVALKMPQTGLKQLGPLKGVHLLLANPIEYTKLSLDRAYQFIEQGSPVEIRVRLLGGQAVKKKMKTPPQDPDAWPWMHEHFPHLRPDFILKGMPEGTQYIIEPVSDGRTIQFVLGRQAQQMPKMDLTKRAFRVKAAVTASLPGDPMAQQWAARQGKTFDAPDVKEEDAEHDELNAKHAAQDTAHEPQSLDPEPSEAQAIYEAERKLRIVKSEMSNWRAKFDRYSGIDRRGMWGKAKNNKHNSKPKLGKAMAEPGTGKGKGKGKKENKVQGRRGGGRDGLST